jgi:hypothetical protein
MRRERCARTGRRAVARFTCGTLTPDERPTDRGGARCGCRAGYVEPVESDLALVTNTLYKLSR